MFSVVVSLLIIQRLVELRLAAQNQKKLKEKGAIEYGSKHYKLIVIMHVLFFISLISEVILLEKTYSPFWPIFLIVIILAQMLRYWSIFSLGEYWNTKIIILPNAHVKKKGPYKYIRHPNYVAVAIEFFFIPLLFEAYRTAFMFSILNSIIMIIRIKEEENALIAQTNYGKVFENTSRFFIKK